MNSFLHSKLRYTHFHFDETNSTLNLDLGAGKSLIYYFPGYSVSVQFN